MSLPIARHFLQASLLFIFTLALYKSDIKITLLYMAHIFPILTHDLIVFQTFPSFLQNPDKPLEPSNLESISINDSR